MVKRSTQDLTRLLREQVDFLLRSSLAFDGGYESEAKRLAVVIRVLVHDTGRSRSVLEQLDLKSRIPYYDTAPPLNPRNLMPEMGFLAAAMSSAPGAKFYTPLLDHVPVNVRLCEFQTWWDRLIIKDSNTSRFSRKKLILGLANTDGGAHVDPELDEEYAALSRGNSLGWHVVAGGASQPIEENAALAATRQITHEVLVTLALSYPYAFSSTHDLATYADNALSFMKEPGTMAPYDLRSTSMRGAALKYAMDHWVRNELCPCGSGIKYKKCTHPQVPPAFLDAEVSGDDTT